MSAVIPDEVLKKMMDDANAKQVAEMERLKSGQWDHIPQMKQQDIVGTYSGLVRPRSLDDDLTDKYIRPALFCFTEIDAFNLNPLAGRSEITHIIVRKEINYHGHLFVATVTADVRYLRREDWPEVVEGSRREVDHQLLGRLKEVEAVRKKILKSVGRSEVVSGSLDEDFEMIRKERTLGV